MGEAVKVVLRVVILLVVKPRAEAKMAGQFWGPALARSESPSLDSRNRICLPNCTRTKTHLQIFK